MRLAVLGSRGVVNQVPSAAHSSQFTPAMERLSACLARVLGRTSIRPLLRLGWRVIAVIVERIVAEREADSRLWVLWASGIDEFRYRKDLRYLRLVVAQDRDKMIWAAGG